MVPTEAVHVTPGVAVPSLVTVAVKVCVCPAASVAVVGVTLTETTGVEVVELLLLLLHPAARRVQTKPAHTASVSRERTERTRRIRTNLNSVS